MRTEDGSIIQECLNGESEAFGVLVDKYKAGIYAFACAKLGDFRDAQDVTQEVFVQAYRGLRGLRRWESFAFWLYRIAYTRCAQWHRVRSKRVDRDFIEDQSPKIMDLPSLNSYRESRVSESVRDALDALPEIYREALMLRYFGGMNSNEMAKALGTSPSAVRKRLSRARTQMKKEIAMMDTAFEEQKLQASFTFRVVDAIKHTKINPMPRMAGLPWGLSLAAGIVIAVLSLSSHINILNPASLPAYSTRPVEAGVLETGEIPVDIMVGSRMLFISGKQEDIAGAILAIETRAASNSGRIVFVRDGIWIMDADGQNEKRLTDGQTPAWSPDGRQIVFSRRTNGQSHIYIMNSDGSNTKQLTDGPVQDMAPTWSPDGKQIAFGREVQGGGPHHIHVMNVDGSNVRNLVKDDNIHTWFNAWSPDGSMIAFHSNRDGQWGDIYLMDADGANIERLTFINSTVAGISWSPDGMKIAYVLYATMPNSEIYIMDADGKNQANITNMPGTYEFCPSWSPDGTKIVFYSNRDGNYEIYIMDADGSNIQRLNVPVNERDIFMSWEGLDWTVFSYAVEPADQLPTKWGEVKSD